MAMDTGTVLGVVGIILAVCALAVGVPPFIQMSRGRPELILNVDDFTGPDGKQLFVTCRNKTISARLLKRIGVIRESGDVTGSFDIQEQGTNKFVAKSVSGWLHNPVLRESSHMARAFPGRTIGMNIIHQADGGAFIIDGRVDETKGFRKIPAGDYWVHATFICGEDVYPMTKYLRVGASPHQTVWV